MSLTSRVLSRVMKLPPAHTHDVRVERALRVPMPDGVELLTDRYVPRGGDALPVVMIRTPYGRDPWVAELWARPFAERGFQVVIQSVRGTHGSGGTFDPFHHERADGLATLAWIKAQPWYGGAIFSFGQSYLGYTQWSIARDAGPELKAMAMQITAAHFADMKYAGGSFALENMLAWTRLMTRREQRFSSVRSLYDLVRRSDPLTPVWRKLPQLGEADSFVTGRTVSFFQDWLEHASPDDPWWAELDFRRSIAEVDKPVSMIAGWDDIFVPWQLRDFTALQAAGRDVQLHVGPWRHLDLGVNALGIRQALLWFRAHLDGDRSQLREKPVRLYVRGAKRWREFDAWPPREAQPQRWHLHVDGVLAQPAARESLPDRYVYDPANPTPAVGGPSLSLRPAVLDNRALEARSDVLVYTSAPLTAALDVIGEPSVELWVSSDRPSTDFFVRLCDVGPSGASHNVCDGLVRVKLAGLPADDRGACSVKLRLWPTAYRFVPGQRLRLQVSSGAYPRWAPNPGTGEPLTARSSWLRQSQALFHDAPRPSAIILPIVPASRE